MAVGMRLHLRIGRFMRMLTNPPVPSATGISYLFRYCGQVFGVGLGGGVLQAILAAQLRKRITGPGSEELIEKIRKVSSIIPSLEPDIRQKAVDSYKVSLRWVFIMNGLLAVLNFLISLPVSATP